MQINGSEATITINLIGEKTGESFMGDFKIKCIVSPMDLIKIDKLYRQMMGDNPHFAEQQAREYGFMFSQLQFRVLDAPKWWKEGEVWGEAIKDKNVLTEILTKALEVEGEYISQKTEQQEEMQKKLKQQLKKNKIQKKETELETPITDE